MGRPRISWGMFLVVLIVFLLHAGICGAGGIVEADSGCELCFTAGGCNLHVTSVQLGSATSDLEGMREDETILSVDLHVVSGDAERVSRCQGDVDVWVTDENGRRNSSRAATTFRDAGGTVISIQWLFAVPESSRSFCLNFPGGETLDLAPFFE